ncbi:TrmH family RNA methyltransferase [Alloscardovia macacae]|uniref:RNA methyltransferase, TrmH family n=1 Tax=Alloscardovia macacae TaxID=1160091 RepID=A0A261F3A6_9BIFI|nr:RNA methyltransferase [Alloscardovia macacae]OZG53602.1 RNA methyltransferase, TrmH family [Alloscardovia macacae]
MPLQNEVMDNPRATRVRHVAELSARKARKKTGLFLVEGPQSVRELIRFAPSDVRDLYIHEQYEDAPVLKDLANEAMLAGIYVHKATDEVLLAMSKDCQGIVAVARAEAVERDPEDFYVKNGSLVAACWQLRDPGNAGTIIRAADAAGCGAVVLVGDCVDVLNPKVIRSTAGSLFHVPVVSMSEEQFFEWCERIQAVLTAADVYGTTNTQVMELNTVLDQTDFRRSQVVLFGNEARGLEPELVDACNRAAVIPLYGQAESLNVAMSASILLYAFALRAHA